MPRHEPLVIVGSGPAALSAAIYASCGGYQPVVFAGDITESGLASAALVRDYLGFPEGLSGTELTKRMLTHAQFLGATIEHTPVTGVDVAGRELVVGGHTRVTYDAVIFATGARRKRLPVLSDTPGVFSSSYDVRDVECAAVIGGGDTACDDALNLAERGIQVTILVRSQMLRAQRVFVEKVLKHPLIHVRFGTSVTEAPQAGFDSLTVRADDETYTVQAQALVVAVGMEPRTQMLVGQVPLRPDGTVITDRPNAWVRDAVYRTPGFFVAGDVSEPEFHQAIAAAGSGAIAGVTAVRFLDAQRTSGV